MTEPSLDRKREGDECPDPEELLRRYGLRDAPQEQSLTAPSHLMRGSVGEAYAHPRGRLRVYLAAAAGAGKTYAMLNEGQRRKQRGSDVVVGYVETHQRPQTEAQIGDLAVLPRKKVSYRGVILEEMDTETILARQPQVVLVDELAHSNVPGSPNAKHFFREGNLTALRELALRRTADKTEKQLQQYMTGHHIEQHWPTSERVMVGFDHRPHTRQVIRAAWRLAHGLHADLIAVSVEPAGYHALSMRVIGLFKYGNQARRQREEARRHLEENATLAEDLGAEVIRTSSRDIARTLVEIARERQVTQLILGQPARSRWEEVIRRSTTNRVLRLRAEIDIHLVPRGQPGD